MIFGLSSQTGLGLCFLLTLRTLLIVFKINDSVVTQRRQWVRFSHVLHLVASVARDNAVIHREISGEKDSLGLEAVVVDCFNTEHQKLCIFLNPQQACLKCFSLVKAIDFSHWFIILTVKVSTKGIHSMLKTFSSLYKGFQLDITREWNKVPCRGVRVHMYSMCV